MVGKTNAGGGGKLTTVIAVAYPAGSICTCGGKKAKDTSGYALFNVKPGTYTVESHTSDNSQSKSTSVTVTESDVGKVIDVTLSYELYIFKSGVGMTSGYSAKFAASAGGTTSNSISNKAITWATNAAQGGNMVISPAVDLSNYSTLHVELDYTGHYDGGYVTFGVGNSTLGSSFTASKADTYNTSKHTITIDVSKITSELYIKSTSEQSAGRFYNIWLT